MKNYLKYITLQNLFFLSFGCAAIVFAIVIGKLEANKCTYFDCFGVIEWTLSVPAMGLLLFLMFNFFKGLVFTPIKNIFTKKEK